MSDEQTQGPLPKPKSKKQRQADAQTPLVPPTVEPEAPPAPSRTPIGGAIPELPKMGTPARLKWNPDIKVADDLGQRSRHMADTAKLLATTRDLCLRLAEAIDELEARDDAPNVHPTLKSIRNLINGDY